MTFDPTKNQRRSIRLAGFDYSHVGAYFVTICSLNQVPLFGSVMDGEMRTNELGDVIRNCWHEIPFHFPGVTLDAFVVMPNHVHGILIVGARHASPAPPLGTIVGSFKSTVRRRARRPVWQRNYYERVVRDERELNAPDSETSKHRPHAH